MTEQEIDELVSSREFDALISEFVFGVKSEWLSDHSELIAEGWAEYQWASMIVNEQVKIPNYSSTIKDAFSVVNKIGLCIDYQTNWVVVSKNTIVLSKTFNNPPLAICRAALKVVLRANGKLTA